MIILFGIFIGFSTFILNDNAVIENKSMFFSKPITGKVKRDKNKLIAGTFKYIDKNLKWNESKELYFKSGSKNSLSEYKFDLEGLSLLESEENFIVENKYKYIVFSEDGSKSAYYNEDDKSIETENIENGKIKKINYEMGSSISRYFNNNITLSKDGGYLFFLEDYGIIFENTFSVFGADSGRLYGDKIKGISPKFSNDSRKVAFFYNGNMDDGYNNAKLGILSLKNKKITYINSHNKDQIIFPDILWDMESKNVFYIFQNRGETDKIYIAKINILTSNASMVSIPFGENINEVDEIAFNNEKIYIMYNDKMITYNYTNTILDKFLNIGYLYDEKKLILLNDGVIVKIDGNIKYLKNSTEEFLYEEQVKAEFISISENEEKIAVIESGEEGYRIIILNTK